MKSVSPSQSSIENVTGFLDAKVRRALSSPSVLVEGERSVSDHDPASTKELFRAFNVCFELRKSRLLL